MICIIGLKGFKGKDIRKLNLRIRVVSKIIAVATCFHLLLNLMKMETKLTSYKISISTKLTYSTSMLLMMIKEQSLINLRILSSSKRNRMNTVNLRNLMISNS
jgi:hypothetical protein